MVDLDRNALKVQAYKEKLAVLEEQNADLRVELTVVNAQSQEKIAELEHRLQEFLSGGVGTAAYDDEIVEPVADAQEQD